MQGAAASAEASPGSQAAARRVSCLQRHGVILPIRSSSSIDDQTFRITRRLFELSAQKMYLASCYLVEFTPAGSQLCTPISFKYPKPDSRPLCEVIVAINPFKLVRFFQNWCTRSDCFAVLSLHAACGRTLSVMYKCVGRSCRRASQSCIEQKTREWTLQPTTRRCCGQLPLKNHASTTNTYF